MRHSTTKGAVTFGKTEKVRNYNEKSQKTAKTVNETVIDFDGLLARYGSNAPRKKMFEIKTT